jgi:hypothetical protein
VIPWSDLTYSLLPNGRTLDYRVTSASADLSPIGVSKQSFTAGLYGVGAVTGYYSAPGTNPQADLTTWNAAINAGEPYDSNPEARSIVRQIARYHSAYYLLDGAYGTRREPPAPLLMANGFTDDLFPVDEGVRFYNFERSSYPSDPAVIARLRVVTGRFPLIAARLWDANPSTHTQTLVARGVYRLDPRRPDGLQVFQLHPGAWHFAAGHAPKLELLGQDAPYARASNGTFKITVSALQLRLPVHERPGARGTPPVVRRPRT